MKSYDNIESNPLEVIVISDYTCPWCYIGKQSLSLASKLTNTPVKVIYQPYITDPNISAEGEDMRDFLLKKFGPEGLDRFMRPGSPIEMAALKLGIPMNQNRRMIKTMNVHRLTEWCNQFFPSKSENLVDNLFHQYYSEAVDISQIDNLVEIAVLSGLDRTEVYRILNSNAFFNNVMEKDTFAKLKLRVSGVPSFTINYQSKRKPFTFSGAQPVEIMIQFLEEARKNS